MKRAFNLLPIGLSLAVLALAGCGSDDESISIENSWARTSAAGQTTGAIYFNLTSEQDDTLVGASVPASIAADAQVHEVVMAEMDESGGTEGSDHMTEMESGDTDHMTEMESGDTDHIDDMDPSAAPAMTMQELTDGLELFAGETVSFKPGSYHVMLVDLVEPLEVGDTVDVTLDFAMSDSITLTVEVAESAP
mgnify:CR=1 FL=1